MKPVEFWVCALVANEPECWDGPHASAALAYASMKKSFNDPSKFGVWEVNARPVPSDPARYTVLLGPTPSPVAKKKPSGSKARTQTQPRPKAPSGSKTRTQARTQTKARR